VFKTTDRAGSKIFINVCSSPQVPKPPEITPEMLQEEAPRVRIPLSMGEPREDSDKTGKPCTVYDAIMHPDPVDRAKTEKDMKQFIVELCLQWIEQKHSLVLSRRVKFPKGLSAKGEPEIQTIRRNTNQVRCPLPLPPPPPPTHTHRHTHTQTHTHTHTQTVCHSDWELPMQRLVLLRT
jgi:hypothetical protein